jgi:prepilin-type N-terminal cleavage/methylation domain-containing protein
VTTSRFSRTHQAGFTLVEILVVVAIIAVIFGLSVVSLGQPQAATNRQDATDTLLSDIKNQQLFAMVGTTGSTSSQQPAGIFVQSNQYTLFTGSSYSAGDGYNYVVAAPQGTTFGTTFPSSIIQFNKGAGDVSGFINGSNTITITTSAGTRTLTFDRYGAVTIT